MIVADKRHDVKWTPEKSQAIWEAYICGHASTAGFFPADFYEIVIRKSRRYLKPQMQCLDVGCGTGTLVKLLARQGYNVTGIDITPGAIEHMCQSLKYDGFDIPLTACPHWAGRKNGSRT